MKVRQVLFFLIQPFFSCGYRLGDHFAGSAAM
jgi:hypothetical protein